MTRPDVLLVDDSSVMLEFLHAALGQHYATRTAASGEEALVRLSEARPAAMLLDLSMPGMSGERVLERVRASDALRDLPVIVVSSEVERGQQCVSSGVAAAFVPKPVRAEELRVVVARVIEDHDARIARDGLAVLFLACGPLEVGIALDGVEQVFMMPETRRLPGGPPYLDQYFERNGEPVCVLDLPARLGVAHTQPLVERKVVLLHGGGARIAVCVDDVREPETFAREQILSRDRVGGSEHDPLRRILRAFVSSSRGPTPVVEPSALFSPDGLRALCDSIPGAKVEGHADA
jgi:CheY-like chemotaxis protein/chemotaxis signal transduction protein